MLVFYWIAGSCKVNLLKTGQDCWEWVNASPGLKFIRIITFSSKQMFFFSAVCFETESQTVNSKLHCKVPKLKKKNILPFPGLAQPGTEQPGEGATLLGWPKSIYYYFHGQKKRTTYRRVNLVLCSKSLGGNCCNWFPWNSLSWNDFNMDS